MCIVVLNNNKNEKNIFSGKETGFGNFFRKGRNSNKFKGPNFNGKFIFYLVAFLFVITVSFLSGFFGSLLNDYLKKDGVENGRVNDSVVVSPEVTDVEGLVAKVLPAVVGVLSPNFESVGGDRSFFGKIPLPFPFMSHSIKVGAEFDNVYGLKFSGFDLGSGFFVRHGNSVYVLTNYHVIEDFVEVSLSNKKNSNDQIQIVLKNDLDNTKKAEIVGYDVDYDFAVLKIVGFDDSNVASLRFADSEKIKIGSMAIALGNPITPSSFTVTKGIVSGLRKIKKDSSSNVTLPVVQTDAAINPGNSGGPLINSKGEVIGMNTCKLRNSQIDGIAFSIDASTISQKFTEIVKTGSKNYGAKVPTIGIVSLSDEGNMFSHGVVIISFEENSTGEKAGLKIGDLIIECDGVKVDTFAELLREIAKHKVGDEVKLTVLRKGSNKPLIIKVSLGSSTRIKGTKSEDSALNITR